MARQTQSQRIAGIRYWVVDEDGMLAAIQMPGSFASEAWPSAPLEAHARCYAPIGHPGESPPKAGCDCGIHAYYSFEQWEKEEDIPYLLTQDTSFSRHHGFDPKENVLGVCSGTGRVIGCEWGFRAERVRVEAIISYKAEVPLLGHRISVVSALERIADSYGVPLIAVEEIDTFCQLEGLQQRSAKRYERMVQREDR